MSLLINTSSIIYKINEDEIIYVSAEGSYSCIHLKTGREIVVSQNIGAVSLKIKKREFIRISRSILLNLLYLKEIDKKQKIIHLHDGTRLSFTCEVKLLLEKL